MDDVRDRVRGCLLGQLIGDALGGLVEFQSSEDIRRAYPNGVRDLADGGTWGTIAGQPTDDSEMALALARVLVERGTYDESAVRDAYLRWLNSGPFDCGNTVSAGLRGRPDPNSQANGALMRISPLGVFGAFRDAETVARWARQDAGLTHPHPVCAMANAIFVRAIGMAIRTGPSPRDLYQTAVADWVTGMATLDAALREAAEKPPEDYTRQQGWVLIAFQNAWWQLLQAESLEEALVDTVMRGGDTDTNAAICGALLGAVHGRGAIPSRWVDAVLDCRPAANDRRVRRPRPPEYWPTDALELADRLVRAHASPD
ncbi:MAG: ADP-ribosylglycohydrolase family protein [Fimbriimonadaceae bacterium]|nr:ADP-ribosylglycohydrolase family protein [Fimbriimonadaceae bacterium]